MSEEKPRHSPIQRIMVALDASTSSMNAMQTALELAARFKSEVLGLFVEDINLLRLAQLPFAREVSFYSDRTRRINTHDMELQLRVQAARIRNRLAQTAERLGVPWEFKTVRGAVGTEVLNAGATADLVVLGKIGRSLPGIHRSGSTVRALLMQRIGMTLVMQTRVAFSKSPVAAVYDGTQTAVKTLDTAVYLAKSHETPLLVFIIGNSSEEVERYRHQAAEQLQAPDIKVRLRPLVRPSLTVLAAHIRYETAGPVIIPCLEDWFAGERLCGLVDEIANPVFLIR
ncbi:MAG: universal stress protein [Desulfobacterales bacterium]